MQRYIRDKQQLHFEWLRPRKHRDIVIDFSTLYIRIKLTPSGDPKSELYFRAPFRIYSDMGL